MGDKEYKSLDEQIGILKSRGLIIADEEAAKRFLERNNYYRISGYSLTLRTHDVFHRGASFQNIVDIYSFDCELRHVILKYTEVIEVTVKSVYSHEFTGRYGATGYLEEAHFTDSLKYREIIDKAEAQKISRLAHESYLKHFMIDLKQEIPLWAYIDLFTISDISFLYKISDSKLKDTVAQVMGLQHRGADLLGKFMHSMTIIRNLCAHGSRLYNRLFEQKPSLNKGEIRLLRKGRDGTPDNGHLFGFILIMRRLLTPVEFTQMKSELSLLAGKYPFVNMKYYGFPENWQEIL